MSPDQARVVAAATAGLTVAAVSAVIDQYLEALAECCWCESTGQVSVLHDAKFAFPDAPDEQTMQTMLVRGMAGDCPNCGGQGRDLENIGWVCRNVLNDNRCSEAAQGGGWGADHSSCGMYLISALPPSVDVLDDHTR